MLDLGRILQTVFEGLDLVRHLLVKVGHFVVQLDQ